MGGNVWEWTSTAAARAPFQVLKGGSFLHKARSIRCANVYAEDPGVAHPDVGFRCARNM
jgi:formylglycine-generating enzyme required for sulfatase activity